MDTIGVIVPIFNVEKYLARCLDSLINQTYKNLYIILINDGSTDKSLEIAKKYVFKDSRFLLINRSNKGLSNARNTGIDFLKNQNIQQEIISLSSNIPKHVRYIEFLDSDDFLEKDCIEKQVLTAKKFGLEIVCSGTKRIAENSSYLGQDYGLLEKCPKEKIIRGFDILKTNKKYFHAAWNLLIDFQFLIKNNIYFIENIIYEDHCFGTLLFLRAEKVFILNHYLYNYTISNNSITRPKEVTQKRLNLNYESWLKTINFFLETKYKKREFDLIEKQIKEFYFPKLCLAIYELNQQNNIKNLLQLKKYRKFLKIKTFVMIYCPSLFLFCKRVKQAINKIFAINGKNH